MTSPASLPAATTPATVPPTDVLEALARAFDHSCDLMLLCRVEASGFFRVIAVNRSYVERLKVIGVDVAVAELVGLDFDGLVARLGLSSETGRSIRDRLLSVVASGVPLEYDETTPVRGGVFQGRSTITPILDANCVCGHVLYSSRDVSTRRGEEDALARNRSMFSNLLGNLSGMAYRCRNDEWWTMEFVSEGIRELAGYAPENVILNRDISWENLIHPEDRALVRAEFGAKAAPGARRSATYRIFTSGGEVRWVFEQALAIGDRAGERIEYYEGIITDVSELKKAELALVEKERTLSAILDHSFQFIGLLDVEGRVLRANGTSLASVGVRAEQVVGRFFWDTPWWAGLPAEQARLRDAIARVAAGEFVRYQTRHPAADGRLLHVDFSLKPVFGADGRVALMIPEGRDITDIRQAQEALRFSEEKFLRAFHGSSSVLCISRLSDGRVLEVNEAFERDFGVSREQAIGKTSVQLGIWTDDAERARFIAELGTAGRIRNLFREIVLPAGKRTQLISVEPIEIDGEPCLLTTAVDVTAQTNAERALRDSEEKFAKAFRSSPHSLTITDRETGRYLDINVGFERLSGYARDEVVGRTSLELNLWVNPQDRQELVRRLAAEGTVRAMEIRFRVKGGGIVITLCNVEAIDLGGRPCLLSAVEDITARRRVEEEKTRLEAQLRQNQKLESLGTLAGGIAHDFNNILTAIIVNQELAAMDPTLSADTRDRIEAISRASNRAKNLVRQILTFSRQEPLLRRRQQLAPLVTEVLGFVRASLPATIEIDQALAPDTPTVRVDENQVHQVVMNLCTNAAQAMRSGRGRLTLRLDLALLDADAIRELPGLAPGRHARLLVADTGHGMDEAVVARIFDPFFTTKGPDEGTGLGLSLVHGIMRDHEGAVRVRSRPGAGTEFELFFPEDRESAAFIAENESDVRPGRGESVLLVDDETAVAEAVAAILRKLGYRVEKFNDPRAAFERFARAPDSFDLLLSDCTMPGLTGPELVDLLRAFRPGLPVLLMTGMRSTATAPVSPGYFAVLDKPPGFSALSLAMRRALEAPSP